MRFSAKIVLCALFGVLALSGTAAARTIYVNAAYTGTYMDGTQAAPYKTIASALLVANASATGWDTGDVVLVMPGRYYGYFQPKNFVTIQGTDPKRVVIYDPMVTASTSAANVRFSKVTFYDDCHTAIIVNRVGLSKGAWIFDDCIFDEIRRGLDARGNVDVWMTRCVFYGTDYEYSFMMEYGTGTATFTNCTFFQPRQNALRLTRTDTGRIEVVNSIFVAPPYIYTIPPSAVFAGTYSYPTTIDLGHLVTVRYSDIYRFGLQASINREALIWSNPVFRIPVISYAQKPDLRLQSTSPCVNTGTDVGLPYLFSGPDMGAYEYDGTPDPPPPPPPPPPTPDPTLPETLEELASSYSDLTEADLETPAEQRRNAFLNKFDALNRQYDDIKSETLKPQNLRKEYENMRDKLTGDLMSKCDAHVGGNESNDWIIDPTERAEIYKLLDQAVSLLDEEIAALP